MINRMGGLVLLLLAGLVLAESAGLNHAGLFSPASLVMDNMVLQQESLAPLWGRGMPGTPVKVQASWGDSAATTVLADSTWLVRIQTPHAGGPFTLRLMHDDTSLTVTNVLTGEVWLCSGQSNMEMPMTGWPPGDTIQGGAAEISSAHYPSLWLCTVHRAYSPVPESTCVASWEECSPATLPGFSATAFYFGKRLQETLRVPVGLIHASWGGTPVESWISGRSLVTVPTYRATLESLAQCGDAKRKTREWLRSYRVIDMQRRKGENRWKNIDCDDSACVTRAYNDSSWRTMNLPTLWEQTEVGSFDGIVWFRRNIAIPQAWVGKDLVVELGPVDDIDITFVNSTFVGGHEGEGMWSVKRSYRIPGAVVDSTALSIAVRVIDFQGGGGIYGEAAGMRLHPEQGGDTISLAGPWKYLPVAELLDNTLYVLGPRGDQYERRPRFSLDLSASTPTTLFNGMISPLVPYAIRGVIWYQGESNADRPREYHTLFPLLIADWRSRFGVGEFPFYYVQIAPFEYGKNTASQYLREAQTATLSVNNCGMAVTLDIGNPRNIHPANKRDVGGRLARWALARTYGQKILYSGPLFSTAKRIRNRIELSFTHTDGGLQLRGGERGNSFQIAGADRVFKDAVVKVRGKTLIVSSPEVARPVAVRYAFSNAPEATLFNGAGLPAPSFRTDDWE